eukprot:12774053-Alexandrium_andersonii.AAC.1
MRRSSPYNAHIPSSCDGRTASQHDNCLHDAHPLSPRYTPGEGVRGRVGAVSYTHLRAHETSAHL